MIVVGLMERMMETQLSKMDSRDKIALMVKMHDYMFDKLSDDAKVKILGELIKELKH